MCFHPNQLQPVNCFCSRRSVSKNMSLINNLEKDVTAPILYSWVACVVISVLSALQADSKTSRTWRLFREILPKAATSCSDCNPTESLNYMAHV